MTDIAAKIEATLETNPNDPRLSPPQAPAPFRGGISCTIIVENKKLNAAALLVEIAGDARREFEGGCFRLGVGQKKRRRR